MAIDPRIALGVQPPQVQSPLDAISTIAQIQGVRELTESRRLAAEEARQKAQDAAAVRQILTETGGDMTAALPRLRQVAPTMALEFETEIESAKKEKHAGLDNQMQARIHGLQFASQIASMVDSPAKAQAVRPFLQGLSSEFGQILPQSDDPAEWRTFANATLSAKDQMDLARADLKLLSEGKVLEAVGSSLARARNQEELDAKIKGFVEDFDVPRGFFTQFGTTWDPEYGARAMQIVRGAAAAPADYTLGPGQTRFSAEGTEIASVPPTPPSPSADPLVSVIGPDGQPVLVPRSQAVGQRPASGSAGMRGVTSGDANRIAEFDTSRDDLAAMSVAITEPGATGTAAKIGAALPKWVTDLTGWGTDAKKKQAVIDRVKQVIGKALEGGVLRKEDEYKYEKILPTIGDAPEIVISKLRGLDAAIEQRRTTTLDALADAGYDVSRFQARPTPPLLGGKTTDAKADPLGIR